MPCPSCGHEIVDTRQAEYTFPYGDEKHRVTLSAAVPVHRCRQCGFEFLDSAAEDRQHEAVCRHLAVMTPGEIREIRQRIGGLSRGEFARITRLGEATIGRWERGELIQNAANDQLLYLLTFPENIVRLRERLSGQREIADAKPVDGNGHTRFRVLAKTKPLAEEAARFRLHTTGAA